MAGTSDSNRSESTFKSRAAWVAFGVVFAASLGVMVGQRLSSEAMAVVVGVIAGVAASIPTSLIVVFVANRAAGGAREIEIRRAEPAEPRVVVVQPHTAYPGGTIPAPGWPAPYGQPTMPHYPMIPAGPRRFTVVGGAGASHEVSADDEANPWAQ